MPSLAFNLTISHKLRKRVRFALAVLPVGLMLGTLVCIFRIALWLAIAVDLDLIRPVKSQPNGLLWLVLFLATIIGLAVSGYVLGWVLNAFICQYIFRWRRTKVRSVFLHSHVPASWLEHDAEKLAIQYRNSWAAVRLKGRDHYILHVGILKWGVWMYVFMAIVPAFRGNQSPSLSRLLWQAGLWACGGALFGAGTWYFSEWRFQRDKCEKNTNV